MDVNSAAAIAAHDAGTTPIVDVSPLYQDIKNTRTIKYNSVIAATETKSPIKASEYCSIFSNLSGQSEKGTVEAVLIKDGVFICKQTPTQPLQYAQN